MKNTHDSSISRRHLMQLAGGAAITAAITAKADKNKAGVNKGRINQSVVHWCWGTVGWKETDTATIPR
tara:strand:- start:26 stop:229 length:204 start_codon:yes stop_codon:yes gene_type:complete